MRQFGDYPPLGLYIHFPWCVKKCPYCDFNSHTARGEIPESAYIDALICDLEQHAPDIWGRHVESVFFGGGTPSLMHSSALEKLLGKIRAIVKLRPDAEITLEANPGTFEQQRFADYRQCGINRLSIGVQSFADSSLAQLGRIHDAADATRAFEQARNAGFDNINLDLMHGLPGQTREQAATDINTAMALAPNHISYYQLTIEPNTLFAAAPPTLPNDDELWNIQQHGRQQLAAQDYSQYEISAYSQPRRQCQHNLNYWQFGDYLGIGAGAHSKLTFAANSEIVRMVKHKHPTRYIDTATGGNQRIQQRQVVSAVDARLEFMMNALRLNDGFDIALFAARVGESLVVVDQPLQRAEQLGLIDRDHRRVVPTERGLQHLNTLLGLFMPDQDEPPTTPTHTISIEVARPE